MTVKSFNLRGTSGTGKTYVARHVLDTMTLVTKHTYGSSYEHLITKKINPKKIAFYSGVVKDTLYFVLGSYETVCGGCDTIPRVSVMAQMLANISKEYEDRGAIIFYEGLLISHSAGGQMGEMIDKLGAENHILGFLDTPVELCLARVRERREERGDTRTFDPSNTIKDHRAVQRAEQNAIRDGKRVVSISHKSPVPHVFEHLEVLTNELQRP